MLFFAGDRRPQVMPKVKYGESGKVAEVEVAKGVWRPVDRESAETLERDGWVQCKIVGSEQVVDICLSCEAKRGRLCCALLSTQTVDKKRRQSWYSHEKGVREKGEGHPALGSFKPPQGAVQYRLTDETISRGDEYCVYAPVDANDQVLPSAKRRMLCRTCYSMGNATQRGGCEFEAAPGKEKQSIVTHRLGCKIPRANHAAPDRPTPKAPPQYLPNGGLEPAIRRRHQDGVAAPSGAGGRAGGGAALLVAAPDGAGGQAGALGVSGGAGSACCGAGSRSGQRAALVPPCGAERASACGYSFLLS